MTRLGLGTAPLGNLFKEVSDTDAAQTVRFAWDSGLRLFDTAPNYGYGLAERRVGALLRERPRDEFVLATKVGRLLRADAPHDPWRDTDDPLYKYESPVGQVPDYSYDGTMRSVEESLARLGLDRVDILHIHDPDDHAQEALKGAYAALAELRSQGVIRAEAQAAHGQARSSELRVIHKESLGHDPVPSPTRSISRSMSGVHESWN